MSNYEEAAKAYAIGYIFPDHVHQASYHGFLAGCAHASKEAHNEAIDNAINLINQKQFSADFSIGYLLIELEKLKL